MGCCRWQLFGLEINKHKKQKKEITKMKRAIIIKVAIGWLTQNSVPQVANNSSVVLQALKDNADIYKDPVPPLADVQTGLDALNAAQIATADGGPSATSYRDQCLLIHISNMRLLANYVQGACGGNLTNLQLSGFPVQKPVRQPVGVLPAPQNLILAQGSRTGELAATVNPVFGASTYTWTLTPGTPGAAVQTLQTTAASCTFANVTPGVSNSVTVNAVGAAGPSSWSQPASLIVN